MSEISFYFPVTILGDFAAERKISNAYLKIKGVLEVYEDIILDAINRVVYDNAWNVQISPR